MTIVWPSPGHSMYTAFWQWGLYWENYTTVTHSQIWHYFISYLLTCEVDIMAQMWDYTIVSAINQQRWLQTIFWTIQKSYKGQLISKAIYGLLTSPKKQTDEFVLFAFLLFTANKSNSSSYFLGESMAWQFAFKINWPLGGTSTQKNLQTNTKTMVSSIWTCPKEPKGCQKKHYHPLNKVFQI